MKKYLKSSLSILFAVVLVASVLSFTSCKDGEEQQDTSKWAPPVIDTDTGWSEIWKP